jgi:hypothetical protein
MTAGRRLKPAQSERRRGLALTREAAKANGSAEVV